MFLSGEPTRSEPPNEPGKHLSGRRLKHSLPAGSKYSYRRWLVQSRSTLHYSILRTVWLSTPLSVSLFILGMGGAYTQSGWWVELTAKYCFVYFFVLVSLSFLYKWYIYRDCQKGQYENISFSLKTSCLWRGKLTFSKWSKMILHNYIYYRWDNWKTKASELSFNPIFLMFIQLAKWGFPFIKSTQMLLFWKINN